MIGITGIRNWDFRSTLEQQSQLEDGGRGSSRRPWKSLSDRTTATIIVLHDLLSLQTPSGLVGPSLVPDPHRLPWMIAKWNPDFAVDAVVPWATPAWPTFWEFNLMRELWNHGVREVRDNAFTTTEEYPTRVWIGGVHAVLLRAGTSGVKMDKQDMRRAGHTSQLWSHFAQAVADDTVLVDGATNLLHELSQEPKPPPQRQVLIEHLLCRQEQGGTCPRVGAAHLPEG